MPIYLLLGTHLGRIAFCDIKISLWDDAKTEFPLLIAANQGSPAAVSGAVRTLPVASLKHACLQTGSWLNECLCQHEDCRNPLCGDIIDESSEPVLPKRVFSVGHASSPSVVLIETNGLGGHYSTLSHCWDPLDKQPLRTTNETINAHLEGMLFEKLPKSFQDAVIVTRAVGLQYLWIDSLCILQGDKEEWEEESKKMGFIYEVSRLAIAAAGAANSTEGCPLWEKYPSPTFSIPHYQRGI